MTGPIHDIYNNARRAEMMREARQSQIAQNVERSRDHERRTFLVGAWLRRQSTRLVVPEVASEAPEVPLPGAP